MRFKCVRDTFFLGQTFHAGEVVELASDPTLPTNKDGEPDENGKGKPLNRHFERVADSARGPMEPNEVQVLRSENEELRAQLAELSEAVFGKGEKKDSKESNGKNK